VADAARSPLIPRRAVQYLRMSTEHQRYSLEHQAAAIGRYAETRGYDVIASYVDEGISGVDIRKRNGLRTLLADVLGGDCAFDTILVYDVSRWGRFQNPDQSAHYEFLCAQAGVHVEYCAELFENDGSIPSTLMKSLKRVMAAEYSRELSVKVSAAKTAMLHRGHWPGGSAGYGLRRQIIHPEGAPGAVLRPGEVKSVQGHHTILVPGPAQEVAIVGRIYRMFTVGRLSRAEIARVLNTEGVPSVADRQWTHMMVTSVLTNPKYVGDLVGNRTVGFLNTPRMRRVETEWVRKPRAFKPIVSRALFDAAQKRLSDASYVQMTRAEMVEALRAIHDQHGKITRRLIDEAPGLPSSGKFARIFGGRPGFYAAIGVRMKHPPPKPKVIVSDEDLLGRLAALLGRSGYLSKKLIDADGALPASTTVGKRLGGLRGAYLRLGFMPLSDRQHLTAIGRARLAAAHAAIAQRSPQSSVGEGEPP
jgi:DNA invertase Pin-like site-specific DNA recombinase